MAGGWLEVSVDDWWLELAGGWLVAGGVWLVAGWRLWLWVGWRQVARIARGRVAGRHPLNQIPIRGSGSSSSFCPRFWFPTVRFRNDSVQ